MSTSLLSKSEVYQLRADVLRGKTLSQDEVLDLLEQLREHIESSDGRDDAEAVCGECGAECSECWT